MTVRHQSSEVFERVYQEGEMVRVSGHTIILSPSLVITRADASKIALDAALTAAAK